MKKIIALLMLACIITSCQFLPTKKEQVNLPTIYTGQKGIALEFLANAPPSEIYENSPFDIILKVHNQGATDIRGGMLILGVEEQNVELTTQKDLRFDLAGKSMYNPEGVYDMKQFRANAKELGPSVAKSYSTTITATACYAYKTSATSIVCIDTDLLGSVKNKPCSTTALSYGSGQGAPVAVTSVIPKMMPHEDTAKITPQFTISVANRGGGDTIAADKIYPACTGQKIGPESWNVVRISTILSDQILQCQPETLTLKPGENTAICTLPAGISKTMGTYTAPLSIELNYGYMSQKVKSMTIIKPVVAGYII